VLDYLVSVGRFTRETAAKRLEFIEHPLWRTYVFVYTEGEALLRRWLDAAPPERRIDRFGRLLREPLTPGTRIYGIIYVAFPMAILIALYGFLFPPKKKEDAPA